MPFIKANQAKWIAIVSLFICYLFPFLWLIVSLLILGKFNSHINNIQVISRLFCDQRVSIRRERQVCGLNAEIFSTGNIENGIFQLTMQSMYLHEGKTVERDIIYTLPVINYRITLISHCCIVFTHKNVHAVEKLTFIY